MIRDEYDHTRGLKHIGQKRGRIFMPLDLCLMSAKRVEAKCEQKVRTTSLSVVWFCNDVGSESGIKINEPLE